MPTTASALVSPGWYCLRSQVKREHIAAAHLRERVDVEVFAPRIRTMHSTRRGVVVNAVEALFPGYLFARFTYAEKVRHVISTNGVTGLVSFGGKPGVVADPVIDYLRREVAQADRAPIAPVLNEGAWVRILSGCFQFLEGQVVHFDPRTERVRLLLSLLGCEVQVSVAAERVALLEESHTSYPSGLMAHSAEADFRASCVG